MYRLIKIYELPQELDNTGEKWLGVDVVDPASPTGYTTKKILASTLKASGLDEVLVVNNNTGPTPIIVDEASALIFNKGVYTATYIPSTLSQDVILKSPTESGKLALELDTQPKKIPVYNGVYGLANTGNVVYRPDIIVRGRTVFIEGLIILPMPTTPGGSTLDTNGLGYVTNYYPDLLQGGNPVGFNIDGRNLAFSNVPILPTALRPEITVRLNGSTRVMNYQRTVNLNGRTRLNSYGGVVLLPDGRLVFGSVESLERNGLTSAGFTKSLHWRKLTDRFNNGDDILAYDNYRNSFSTGFTVDNRTVIDTGANYTYSMDGTKSEDLGGFVLRLSVSYTLPNTRTLQEIETAFNSL